MPIFHLPFGSSCSTTIEISGEGSHLPTSSVIGPEFRLGEVRADVGILVTPRIPGSHALPEDREVLMVRHAKQPVLLDIFAP